MPSKAFSPSEAGSGCHSGAAWAGPAAPSTTGTASAATARERRRVLRGNSGIVGVSFLTTSSAGVHIGRRTDPAIPGGHPMSTVSKLEPTTTCVNGRRVAGLLGQEFIRWVPARGTADRFPDTVRTKEGRWRVEISPPPVRGRERSDRAPRPPLGGTGGGRRRPARVGEAPGQRDRRVDLAAAGGGRARVREAGRPHRR